jgi:Protein of unknown function (DUF2804)
MEPEATLPEVESDLSGPLVDRASGAVRVAAFSGAVLEPDLERAPFPHALSGLAGRPLVRYLEALYRRRLRLKTWQYMTMVSERWFVALAVADAGFAGNGFLYAIDRTTGELRRRFVIRPLGVGCALSPTSARGQHRFRSRSLAIEIDNLDGGRRFAVRFDGRFAGSGAAGQRFRGEVELASDPSDQHLGLCVPLPTGRWNYTHKFGAFRVRGQAELGGSTVVFDPASCFGTVDYSKMAALRHAVWRWVAACGRSRQGPVVGVNLVDPTPEAPVAENGLWIDGRFEPLHGIRLAVTDPADPRSSWRLVDGQGRLDIRFDALAHVDQTLRLPLLRHRLRHVGGSLSGRVATRSGQALDLDRIFGIAEDNDTWW